MGTLWVLTVFPRRLDVSSLEAHSMPALNSLYRGKLSLEEEQVRNEVSDCKIIGNRGTVLLFS